MSKEQQGKGNTTNASQDEDKGDKHEGKSNKADEDEDETNMARKDNTKMKKQNLYSRKIGNTIHY